MKVLFYGKESQCVGTDSIEPKRGYTYSLWIPSRTSVVPPGIPKMPFAVWWAMHHLRLLGNRDYGLFLIFRGNEMVHRSCVFPRYFRFPFMERDDLQIGDTWTAEKERGAGLATFAIHKILELKKKPGRRFWYVTEEENTPSIRVVEKAGFSAIGKGERIDRLGISLLGSYVLQTRTTAGSHPSVTKSI